MDERAVFERFHEALELQPQSGAYERFRAAFITAPAAAKPRRPVFRMRFSKMSLRVAAAVAVVAIAIALVAGVLATHRPTAGVPAGTSSPAAIKAYQTMMRNDDDTMAAGTSTSCGPDTPNDPTCLPAIQRTIPNLQKWVADIDAVQTPAPFAVVAPQMRQHLIAAINELKITEAAIQSGNHALFRISLGIAGNMHRAWVDTVVAAIARYSPVPASQYKEFVTSEKAVLDGCGNCQDLQTRSIAACAGSSLDDCLNDIWLADLLLSNVQSGVVANGAPESLGRSDLQLQTDLARADSSIVKLADALIAGDEAAFAGALGVYGPAATAVTSDMAAISGS